MSRYFFIGGRQSKFAQRVREEKRMANAAPKVRRNFVAAERKTDPYLSENDHAGVPNRNSLSRYLCCQQL